MIIDSSALIAILFDEPERDKFARAIEAAGVTRVSAATILEASIVADIAREPVLSRRFDELVREANLVIEPFTAEHAAIAREAYADYGKGSGHPAKLNFGDCLAYALAFATGEPLLFKGDDFPHTDIRPAV